MPAPPQPRRCNRCGGPLPSHYPPCKHGIDTKRESTHPRLVEDEQREPTAGQETPPKLTSEIIERALRQALPGARELHKLLEPLAQLTPAQASLVLR